MIRVITAVSFIVTPAIVSAVFHADRTTTTRTPFASVECDTHDVHDVPLLHSFNGTIGTGRATAFQTKCFLPDKSDRACYWWPSNAQPAILTGDCRLTLQPRTYDEYLLASLDTQQALCTAKGSVPSSKKLSRSSFTCADRSMRMFGEQCMFLATDLVTRECVFVCRNREEFPLVETSWSWKLRQSTPDFEFSVFLFSVAAQLWVAHAVTSSGEQQALWVYALAWIAYFRWSQ